MLSVTRSFATRRHPHDGNTSQPKPCNPAVVANRSRPVRCSHFQALALRRARRESDVVAIVESIENVPAQDNSPFAVDTHPSTHFAAPNTRFRVAAILKATGEPLSSLLFCISNTPGTSGLRTARTLFALESVPFNTRSGTSSMASPQVKSIALQQQPVWLAFLKQREDGRFEPVTGTMFRRSFRELHEPSFYSPR